MKWNWQQADPPNFIYHIAKIDESENAFSVQGFCLAHSNI